MLLIFLQNTAVKAKRLLYNQPGNPCSAIESISLHASAHMKSGNSDLQSAETLWYLGTNLKQAGSCLITFVL